MRGGGFEHSLVILEVDVCVYVRARKKSEGVCVGERTRKDRQIKDKEKEEKKQTVVR